MIWIITAMAEEAQFIIDLYQLEEVEKLQNIKIYKKNNIVLALTWIGKIQASIGTTILFEKYNPEYIINIWIAWNTWKETNSKVWDIFIIKKIYQHDGYLPFDWEHLYYFNKAIELNQDSKIFTELQNKDFNIYLEWICATGDQFIDDEEKIEKIKNATNAQVVEMEAFAVASVCREYNKLDKLIIIKAISDNADKNAHSEHENNLEIAMKNSIKVLEKIVETMEKVFPL